MRLAFSASGSRDRALTVIAERLVNAFVELKPASAKARAVIYPTPGLLAFTTLPGGRIRGMTILREYLIVVAGTTVYRVDAVAAWVVLGTVPDGGPVSMASSPTQCLIVVPETTQAFVATTTTLTQVTDGDFPGAVACTYVSGYFVIAEPNSGRFDVSNLNDALAWDALDYSTAEGLADNVATVLRVGGDLWVVGNRSVEIWGASGSADFPFQRYPGGVLERGTVARHSVVATTDPQTGAVVPLWLDHGGIVRQGGGRDAKRISTHEVEKAIAGYPIVSDAVGLVHETDGHVFYCLSFPTAGATWCYDLATTLWHERESVGYDTWRVHTALMDGQRAIAGDARDGRLYLIDPTVATEDGDTIVRSIAGTTLHDEGKRVFHSSVEIEMETGVGLASGQGSDPVVWLQRSDDAGHTWSDPIARHIGKQGKYRTQVRWNRCGAARNRVYRLGWSDPVVTAVIAADLDLASGSR